MHVLQPHETAQLLALLFSADDRPFAALSGALHAAFGAPNLFSACCAIVLLLEDPSLLSSPQRLAAWYLLLTAWDPRPVTANPFVPYLVKAAGNRSVRAHERNLLLELLRLRQGGAAAAAAGAAQQQPQPAGAAAAAASPVWRSVGESPSEYCDSCDLGAVRLASSPEELKALEVALLSGLPRPVPPSCFAAAALPRWLPDGGGGDGGALPPDGAAAASPGADASARRTAAAALVSAIGLPLRGLEPAWERPAPPVLSPSLEEYKWLEVDLNQDLVWDSSMCEDSSRLSTVRDLVTRALRGPLLPAQQQQVLLELDAEPALVHRTGLTPQRLPSLVEHCPVLAFELLLRLGKAPTFGEYLSVLASTEMSLHSMEVVNRLTTAVCLPTDFIHLYIANCIGSCESTQDKYVQNRLVRLVCVFLQSLIRNKVINFADLLPEVQAFCINFSRIKEAAKLFRLLKQIEAGGAVRPGDGSPTGTSNADLFSHHSFVDDGGDDGPAGGSQAGGA